jgi:predicted ATP-grasp superfamily ATP-dependent carboligase
MRPLAESAASFGHDICVVDACADRDTLKACAGRLVRLDGPLPWQIDATALQLALRTAQGRFAPGGFAGIIPGSGFEAQPELLDVLAASAPIAGCEASTLHAVRQPRRWFELLDGVGAPHPAVRFDSAPKLPAGWLVKSSGGSGGWHIRAWQPEMTTVANDYFQQFTPGRPASALFLADGRNSRVIGWQWQRLASSAKLPWRYGGVLVAPDLAPALRERVADLCSAIVKRVPLRGLASLDFLVDGEGFSVLELNPRPTASIGLYPQHDFLDLQVRASAGEMPEIAQDKNTEIAGEAVLYAAKFSPIASTFRWPEWCRDIPAGESRIASGQPICSVRASAMTPQAVEAKLNSRIETLSIAFKENRLHDHIPHQRKHSRPAARPGAAF